MVHAIGVYTDTYLSDIYELDTVAKMRKECIGIIKNGLSKSFISLSLIHRIPSGSRLPYRKHYEHQECRDELRQL